MSRGNVVLLSCIGAAVGAYLGAPFLDDGAVCTGQRALECQLNQAYLPFLSAVTIGMVVAVVIGLFVRHLGKHGLHRAPGRRQTRRAALEVNDDYLQLATWGVAPHGRRASHSESGRREVAQEVAPSVKAPGPPAGPAGLGRRGRPVARPHRAG